MNEDHAAWSRSEILAMPVVRLVLCDAGGGFLGGVNQGSCYVRIAPHEERIFSFGRLWRETLQRPTLGRLHGNYVAAGRDAGGARRLAQVSPICASRCATRRRSTSAAATGTSISFCAARTRSAGRLCRAVARNVRKDLGIIDADTTLKLNKPELRVRSIAQRAADLGVDTADIATRLRLMVGGDEEVSRFIDPIRQRRLRRAIAS